VCEDSTCNVDRQPGEKQESDHPVELAKDQGERGQADGDDQGDHAVAPDRRRIDGDRLDQQHHRQDEEDVADVRAKHVAQGDAG